MSEFIKAAGNLIHSIGDCIKAIFGCIKSLGKAFWSALKILWFTYVSYVEFICAIFEGLWDLVKAGKALILQIFIPPKGQKTNDPSIDRIIQGIEDIIGDQKYNVPVSEFEVLNNEGGYMTVGMNKETGGIINSKEGKPLTFTRDIDEKSKQLIRNRGAAVIGTFA